MENDARKMDNVYTAGYEGTQCPSVLSELKRGLQVSSA